MLRKEIPRGEMMPTWYGVAWCDYTRMDVYVCYPLPLNIVMNLLRAVWIEVKQPYQCWHDWNRKGDR